MSNGSFTQNSGHPRYPRYPLLFYCSIESEPTVLDSGAIDYTLTGQILINLLFDGNDLGTIHFGNFRQSLFSQGVK